MTHDNTGLAGRPSAPTEHDPIDSLDASLDGHLTVPNGEAIPGDAARPKTAGKSRATREIIETLLLALVIFVAVRLVVLNFKVDGGSMTPNLQDQEMLLVNRNVYFHFDSNELWNLLPWEDRDGENIVYLFHPPERGDIVVFDPPAQSPKPYIKRVIGLAGDRITFENDYVYVNGEKLDEPYIDGAITECNGSFCDVVVPEGEIYVLGDNRRNSSDSRFLGPVSVDSIIGKAWFTYWPLGELGLVPHFDYPSVPES